MRAEHAATFNHDLLAAGYDADVADETNPIRAGYAATLDWVVAAGAVGVDDVVADLGAGTGNLSARFAVGPRRLVCVDVSAAMLDEARGKLGDRVEYVVADLLEFLDGSSTDPDVPEFDVLVTTYAAHHLTDDEKTAFITAAHRRLRPGGRLVVGDLMAASRDVVGAVCEQLGHPDVDELFAEEFPWWVDEAIVQLAAAGFEAIRCAQQSALSWTLAAVKP